MYGSDIRTKREKMVGDGPILQLDATVSLNGEKAGLTAAEERTAQPCIKAGMVNGTMLVVVPSIPSYVRLVLWLTNFAPSKPSNSNIKD